MSSLSESEWKAEIRSTHKTYGLMSRAYQDFALDACHRNGTPQSHWPNETEEFWKQVATFLSASKDRHNTTLYELRAETDPNFEKEITARSGVMEERLEERLSGGSFMTAKEMESLKAINTFVAERVGASLIPSKEGGSGMLEESYRAFAKMSEGCHPEQVNQLRRDTFVELQEVLSSR